MDLQRGYIAVKYRTTGLYFGLAIQNSGLLVSFHNSSPVLIFLLKLNYNNVKNYGTVVL
jgi:hypothetical protein